MAGELANFFCLLFIIYVGFSGMATLKLVANSNIHFSRVSVQQLVKFLKGVHNRNIYLGLPNSN